MDILAIILSGLALLAAMISFVLLWQEKKRSEKQRAESLVENGKRYEEELKFRAAVSQELEKYRQQIENLEKGIVPDFEEARAAAKAVDEFNRGLSGILNFSPMTSMQKEQDRAQGREVD